MDRETLLHPFFLEETQFFHGSDPKPFDPENISPKIPLAGNFLYALLLLHSRKKEAVLQAQDLLDRLFPFEVEGNFPVYLHEYPVCHYRFHALDIAPTVADILEFFGRVLSSSTREKLSALHKRIGDKMEEDLKGVLKPLTHFRLLASLARMGRDEGRWSAFDSAILSSYSSPQDLGKMILAMREAKDFDFLAQVAPYWNQPLSCYVGVSPQEAYFQGSARATFFSFAMRKILGEKEEDLVRSLVPDKAVLESVWAFSLPKISGLPLDASAVSFAHTAEHLVFRWKEGDQIVSFTFEAKGDVKVSWKEEEKRAMIEIKLPEEVPPPTKERAYEVKFFWTLTDTFKLYRGGKPATLFFPGDPVSCVSEKMEVTLFFEVCEGEGDFTGHSVRGNRKNEQAACGEERFKAYDRGIYIRTLRRTSATTLRFCVSAHNIIPEVDVEHSSRNSPSLRG